MKILVWGLGLEEFARLVTRAGQTQTILDLVRLCEEPTSLTQARYEGISW